MAWFADLSPCSYFGQEYAGFLRAVGWLERTHDFTTGTVDASVYRRLVELLQAPWEPRTFLGTHGCQLCHYEPGRHGRRNLFVPGDGVVYVCPELVVHYMNAHGYAPPGEFCQAVANCPEMSSAQYFKALLAGGARALVFAARGER
jgi:hypothetical protein